jgi:hypothetical protein
MADKQTDLNLSEIIAVASILEIGMSVMADAEETTGYEFSENIRDQILTLARSAAVKFDDIITENIPDYPRFTDRSNHPATKAKIAPIKKGKK